jgi:5-methylthioadenosine/S-adenosylhomocysteine deaminase
VRYLAALGVLKRATVVHACELEDGDAALLADAVRGVVTCPRSNRFLHNSPPPVAPLLALNIAVGAGTDSSASNVDLDLLGEIRALRRAEPTIPSRTLVEIATSRGAQAIGVSDRFGRLAPGYQADLAVFALGATDDPEDAVVSRAGAASVRAVASGGVWRVVDGELVARDERAAARAARARRSSIETLT